MRAIEEIILGNSLAIKEMKKLIEMVSTAATTVLIQGETGTGKELVAEALHVASGRKGDNISVNCAAIPSELLESELFGHEKGAFTGADRARAGRFEQANNGTIFIDEVGDLDDENFYTIIQYIMKRKLNPVTATPRVTWVIPEFYHLVGTGNHKILDEKNRSSWKRKVDPIES